MNKPPRERYTRKPNNIHAVICDFDDTLLATRLLRINLLLKTLGDYGHVILVDQLLLHWGKPFNELISSVAPRVNYDKFLLDYSKGMQRERPQILPGAETLLKFLDSINVPCFIVSSGSRFLVEQDLEAVHLLQYVTQIWGFEDTPYHKPDGRVLYPLLCALKEKKVDAEDVVYIGDGLADLQVAAVNHLSFVAVLTGLHTKAEFERAGLGGEFIISSLSELLCRTSWFRIAFAPSETP